MSTNFYIEEIGPVQHVNVSTDNYFTRKELVDAHPNLLSVLQPVTSTIQDLPDDYLKTVIEDYYEQDYETAIRDLVSYTPKEDILIALCRAYESQIRDEGYYFFQDDKLALFVPVDMVTREPMILYPYELTEVRYLDRHYTLSRELYEELWALERGIVPEALVAKIAAFNQLDLTDLSAPNRVLLYM